MFDRLKRRNSDEEFRPDPFLHDTSRPLTEDRGDFRTDDEVYATRLDFVKFAVVAVAGGVTRKISKKSEIGPGGDA